MSLRDRIARNTTPMSPTRQKVLKHSDEIVSLYHEGYTFKAIAQAVIEEEKIEKAIQTIMGYVREICQRADGLLPPIKFSKNSEHHEASPEPEPTIDDNEIIINVPETEPLEQPLPQSQAQPQPTVQ